MIGNTSSEELKFEDLRERVRTVFRGGYEVTGVLSTSGGMGSVYIVKPQDLRTNELALKVVDKRTPENRSINIYSELKALEKIQHNNIVRIIEAREDDIYVYMVQELIHGVTLRQIRSRNGRSGEPNGGHLSESDIMLWMDDVAGALEYLHRNGIIHRDIKPDNIMIDYEGRAKIIDFGLARNLDTPMGDRPQKGLGSAPYSPLERFEGVPDSILTDVYGYGTTFYSVFTRDVPPIYAHEFSTLIRRGQDIRTYYMQGYRYMLQKMSVIETASVRELLRNCIEVNPARRMKNFTEVRVWLQRSDYFEKEIARRARGRKRLAAGWAGVFLLGLAVAAGGGWRFHLDQAQYYRDLVQKGNTEYEASRFDEAAETYEKAIRFSRRRPEAYVGRYRIRFDDAGKQSEDEGRKKAYLNIADSIGADQERYKGLTNNRELVRLEADAYYEAGQFDSVIRLLGSRDESAMDEDLYMLLGHACIEEQDGDAAREALSHITSEENEDNATILEAHIDEMDGEYDAAIEKYGSVVDSADDEHSLEALKQIVRIYMDRREYEDAIRVIEAEYNRRYYSSDYDINKLLLESYEGIRRFRKVAKQGANLIRIRSTSSYGYDKKSQAEIELAEFNKAMDTIDQWDGRILSKKGLSACAEVRRASVYAAKIDREMKDAAKARKDNKFFVECYENAKKDYENLGEDFQKELDQLTDSYDVAKGALER